MSLSHLKELYLIVWQHKKINWSVSYPKRSDTIQVKCYNIIKFIDIQLFSLITNTFLVLRMLWKEISIKKRFLTYPFLMKEFSIVGKNIWNNKQSFTWKYVKWCLSLFKKGRATMLIRKYEACTISSLSWSQRAQILFKNCLFREC